MYEVRNAQWIKDDIEIHRRDATQMILSGKANPEYFVSHSAADLLHLCDQMETGLSLLHEGDIVKDLTPSEQVDIRQYISAVSNDISSMRQFVCSMKK